MIVSASEARELSRSCFKPSGLDAIKLSKILTLISEEIVAAASTGDTSIEFTYTNSWIDLRAIAEQPRHLTKVDSHAATIIRDKLKEAGYKVGAKRRGYIYVSWE